jgi:uncharacterized protein YprB with RNaseH-like and TPR domain
MNSHMLSTEPDQLVKYWISSYKDSNINDYYDAVEAVSPLSSAYVCLKVSHRYDLDLHAQIDSKGAEKILCSVLHLVHGIGPWWQRKLYKEGISDLSDLSSHPRFGNKALELLQIIQAKDARTLFNIMRHMEKSNAYALGLCLIPFLETSNFAFIDVETLGLVNEMVIVFGFAIPRRGFIEITQYVARNAKEELAVIEWANAVLSEADIVISYNGLSADIRWIRHRSALYGFRFSNDNVHLDLLHVARRLFRDQLPEFSLASVGSNILGIYIDPNLPDGAAVPYFYRKYLTTKQIGPLVAILEHNLNDLIALCMLAQRCMDHVQQMPQLRSH